MSTEFLINSYFYLLAVMWILSSVICLIYWIKLITHIRWKKPEYWKKLYFGGILPRGKTFLRFYYGNEDFKDVKIKQYKTKFRMFFISSVVFFLLIILSMLLFSII